MSAARVLLCALVLLIFPGNGCGAVPSRPTLGVRVRAVTEVILGGATVIAWEFVCVAGILVGVDCGSRVLPGVDDDNVDDDGGRADDQRNDGP